MGVLMGSSGQNAIQNVQTVNMVKTVGKIAAQLVIVVIKSQAFVNTAVNQDGKATIVKRYVQMAFLVETV